MLKTACVFDSAIIKGFYHSVNVQNEFNETTIYFALYKDESIIGIVTLNQNNTKCFIGEVVGNSEITKDSTEFLLKSAINYALTFQNLHLICNIVYKEFLVPMNFFEVSGEMIGDVERVDCPPVF